MRQPEKKTVWLSELQNVFLPYGLYFRLHLPYQRKGSLKCLPTKKAA